MTFAKRSLFSAAALCVLLACPMLTSAQDYQLVFDRPFAVGDQMMVAGEAYITQEMQQRVNGETTEETSNHAELNMRGVIEVLAVNELGGVTELALVVRDHDIEIDDNAIAIQADSRIIARVEDGETVFSYEAGGAIDGEFAELLGMFLDDIIDDDGDGGDSAQKLNLGEARAVGDVWAMNHELMAQDARDEGAMTISADDMESEVRFVEVVEDSDFGVPMVVVELEMSIGAFTFTVDDFPEWLEFKESHIEMTGEGRVPVEPTAHKGLHTMEVEMAFLASGTVPGQDDVLVEVEFEMERGTSLVYGEAR